MTLFFIIFGSILVAAEKSFDEQQQKVFVFDVSIIAKEISDQSYEILRIKQLLGTIPDGKKTKNFVETLKKVMKGIEYGKDDLIKKLSDIDPKHYTESFSRLVLELSPGEESGSRRLKIIDGLQSISPDVYEKQEFKNTLKILMNGIEYSKDQFIKKWSDIDPKYYTESFAEFVLELSPGEESGSRRLEIIDGLQSISQDVYKKKEFKNTLKKLMNGIKYSKDQFIKKWSDIDPKYYVESFAEFVLELSPGEEHGSRRLAIIDDLQSISPDVYTNQDFQNTLKKVITGIKYNKDQIIKKWSDIDPKYYTESFAEFVLELSPGEEHGLYRLEIIQALQNSNVEVLNKLMDCLKKNGLNNDFFEFMVDICIKFSKDSKNVDKLNDFLESIEDNQKRGSAVIFMEYHSNPNLIKKAMDRLIQLKTVDFQAPIDMHLLEQIVGISDSNRLGRHDESLSLVSDTDDKNYLMDFKGIFSNDSNLGDGIKDYFKKIKRPYDGLYEYAIGGSVPIELSKGIIISNYGGYGGVDFSYSASVREKQLIRMGYTTIDLQTRDNWQTIFQGDQFSGPSGKELLGDTLIQFFLFAKKLKDQFPAKQLFFSSGSFGGTKGALINLILSNKNNLRDVFTDGFKDLADRLTLFFEENPEVTSDLIQGYILHDGAYDYFWDRNNVIRKYFVSNPMLLLQNFDDERVTADQTFDFYEKLKKNKTKNTNLFIHITPEGASSVLQKGDIHGAGTLITSLEGHYKPEVEKYRTEYDQKILEFLAHVGGAFKSTQKDLYREGINQIRIRHASTLWDANNTDFTILYRLYYANLHNEKSSDSITMIDRLAKTFAQYAAYLATTDLTKTVNEHYKEIVNSCGLWLIAKIFDKNEKEIKTVGRFLKQNGESVNQLLNEYRLKSAQEEKPDEKLDSPAYINKDETRVFVVTMGARSYLNTKDNSLDLLKIAKDYSVNITKELLMFIEKKGDALSKSDIEELWNIQNLPDHDLKIMSRSISLIMQQKKIKATEIETVLESVLRWNPMGVLMNFYKKQLETHEFLEIIEILLSIEESKRADFLSDICELLPSVDAVPIMIWLTKIPADIKQDVIDNYQRALTIIFKDGIDKQKEIATFLRGLDFDVLKSLKLDNQLFGFMKDMNEMVELDPSQWSDFFNQRYGYVGRFLDDPQIEEHIIKTSGKKVENTSTEVIDLEQILLTISNHTNVSQKFNLGIMFQDKFGKGQTHLENNQYVVLSPKEARVIKRKELRSEFNGITSILDNLKFISFKLWNENCSMEDKIGKHLIISLDVDKKCIISRTSL